MARTKKGVQPQDSTPNGSAHDSAAMTEQDQGMPVADLEDSVLGNQRPAPFKTWKRRSLKMIVVGDSGMQPNSVVHQPFERVESANLTHLVSFHLPNLRRARQEHLDQGVALYTTGTPAGESLLA